MSDTTHDAAERLTEWMGRYGYSYQQGLLDDITSVIAELTRLRKRNQELSMLAVRASDFIASADDVPAFVSTYTVRDLREYAEMKDCVRKCFECVEDVE